MSALRLNRYQRFQKYVLYQSRTQLSTSSTLKADSKPKPSVTPSKSFVMNIFLGKIETEQILPFPKVLNQDQTELLTQMVHPTEKFMQEKNNAFKNDELEAVEQSTLDEMKTMGAFGLQVPEDLGGVGLNNTQYNRMVEIIGAHDLGLGIALGAHQSIGFKGILLYGTPEQKAKYLPDLASGKKMAAYCLTEPSSGSDASSIQTRAELSPDGKHYILNGGKVWISNGGVAEIFTVFARTVVKDESGIEKDKLSAFIVERGFGGITSGPPEKKMGIKASNTAALYLENCKVPAENLLGGLGNGFKVAMNILNNGRFGMAGALSGTMRTCIYMAAEHAAQRKQFGDLIMNYGAIQEKISKMTALHYATESMAYMLSGIMDLGATDYQLEAAISKVFASESAWFCCDEAIQTLGGMGYMKETGIERVMRDVRIFRIFEGANDILRLFIALTGMQYAGKFMTQTPSWQIGLGMIQNKIKQLLGVQSLTESHPNFISGVHPQLKVSAQKASQCVALFGITVQQLLISHRKNIIHRQFELKRVSQAAIDIYGMVASLSRCSQSINNNSPSKDLEIQITELFCNLASYSAMENMRILSEGIDTPSIPLMTNISTAVCKNGGCIQSNPLGI